MSVEKLDVGIGVEIPQFSIIGVYEPEATFVRHVALAREHIGNYVSNGVLPVWQMSPPLAAGVISQQHREAQDFLNGPNLAAHDELTTEELEGMETWLVEVDTERRPDFKWSHYVVCPHIDSKLDERGMVLYRRFSCSGFVLECYRSVDVNLVDTDLLPACDIETLARVYGNAILNQRLREKWKLGLDGADPWPVLLPGYLIHSMLRFHFEIRNSTHQSSTLSEGSYS